MALYYFVFVDFFDSLSILYNLFTHDLPQVQITGYVCH